ncbi:MAG: hypothetical protein ACYTGQ_15100 [Planctomycetota bacterium]|jgi:hypothetical protein
MPDQQVKDYYASQTLPEERIEAILGMREVAVDSYRWRRVATMAVAATVLLAATCGFLLFQTPPTGGPVADSPVPPAIPDPVNAQTQLAGLGSESLRVISVKAHGERCPSCKNTKNNAEQLRQDFQNRPVLFVHLDRSNPALANQSQLLSDALGMRDIYENSQRHGRFVLADAQGRLLEELDVETSLNVLTEHIDSRLNTP